MRRLAASVLAFGLAATAAGAQELGHTDGAASLFGPFTRDMVSTPSNAEVAAAWPAQAKAKGLGGSAVARCEVDAAGELSGCQLMFERSRAGFGAALISLAPRFRLKPAAQGKRPERAEAIITASWPVVDTAPGWRTPPKPGDFATTTTPAAWRTGKPGTAVINCLEGRLGALHDCVAIYQDPPGKGFGMMLLRFQSFFRLTPALVAGKPVETGLNISITFEPLKPGEVL